MNYKIGVADASKRLGMFRCCVFGWWFTLGIVVRPCARGAEEALQQLFTQRVDIKESSDPPE